MRQLSDHIEKLSVFLEVARAKSFHRAARNLGLSQPALSQAVRILEDTVNAKLFLRSQKGVELTVTGVKLLHFSERMFSEVEGIENRLRHPDQAMIGTIKLGAYASVVSYLLPKFLVHMAKKYDRLSINIATVRADALAEALLERRCHFVIGTGRLAQKSITQLELYDDHYGFFCASSQKKSYLGAPLIYISGLKDGKGRTLDLLLSDLSFSRNQRYEVDSFDSIRALACEGLGVGILPLRVAQEAVEKGQLVQVTVPGLGRKFGRHPFFGSYLGRDSDDPRLSVVIAELRQWCR